MGTMILTKLLEVQQHFQGMKIYVSTRQPHLLKEFKQEFDIEVSFNNERVARKADLLFSMMTSVSG
jgi:pyrroline-5-carboxylate reductase